MEAVRKYLTLIWDFFAPYYNYIFLFSYLFIGYAFYNAYEGWGLEMAFGFMIVTISTVGYGYTVPTDDTSRLFTIFYIFIGVYFIFSMISEILMNRLAYIQKFVKKDFHENNVDVHSVEMSHNKTFFIYFVVIVITLLVGAAILQSLEGWSFISSLYFAVETMTTVGYGDLPIHHKHTRTFLAFYILVSVVLLAFIINSVQQLKSEKDQLEKIKDILIKKTNLEFLKNINDGKGVNEAEFVLAILAHLGTIDNERDVDPWIAKFREFDVGKTGVLKTGDLETFIVRESEAAGGRLSVFDNSRPSLLEPRRLTAKEVMAARLSSNAEDSRSDWMNNNLRASLTSNPNSISSSVQNSFSAAHPPRSSTTVRPSGSVANPMNVSRGDDSLQDKL